MPLCEHENPDECPNHGRREDKLKMTDTTKPKPDDYKMVSAGRHLQREADKIDESVEKNKSDLPLSVAAMMKVDAQHFREVGDWLVELGAR